MRWTHYLEGPLACNAVMNETCVSTVAQQALVSLILPFCAFFFLSSERCRGYGNGTCLSLHPVKTQVISSGFLWGLGDIAAQYTNHSTSSIRRLQSSSDADPEFKINWKRVGITSMFGTAYMGPLGHFWYEGLDQLIRYKHKLAPKSAKFIAAQEAIDGIIFDPLCQLTFFTYMGFANEKTPPQVKEDLKRDFLPALILEGGTWPIVQVVTSGMFGSDTSSSMSTHSAF